MCQREMESTRDTGALLQGEQTNFCLQPLTLGFGKGGWSILELLEKRLRFVALGSELKRQSHNTCAESPSHTANAIFLG